MQNFFYDYHFFSDFDEFASWVEETYDIESLDLDTTWELQKTKEEKIFKGDEQFFRNLLGAIYEMNEDRYSVNEEKEDEEILKAFMESIDLKKFNSLLPTLHYMTNEYFTVTAKEIIEYLES